MTTEGPNYGIEVEPLIVQQTCTAPADEWSQHNDPELLVQRTVLNLNNRHVRLTLWCLVYIILTTTQMSNNTYSYINLDNRDTDSDVDDELQYFSFGISANSILWWATAILLCSFYCSCCKMNCGMCCTVLFVIGAVMQFATMIEGIVYICNDGEYNVGTGKDECRSLFIGGAIYLALFSFYLAVDINYSIGDNIRVRIAAKSLFVALRSFLLFVYWNKMLNNIVDMDLPRYLSEKYLYRTLSGGNLGAGIVCSIIWLLIITGHGKDNKTLHPFIARLLAYFLLAATGSTLLLGLLYGHILYQLSTYYVVAAVLIVYDLQYL